LVTYGLCILGVLVGFQTFATHFLDETLLQNMAHIDDLPFLGDAHISLGILSSFVAHQPSYLTRTILLYLSSCLFWHFLIGKLCMYVGT
jgi:hypothetical protein